MIENILSIGTKLIDRLIPDKSEQDKAKIRLIELQQAGELQLLQADLQVAISQNEVNKQEAASPDRFVSGWRPFVGWVCGLALAYHYIIQPFLVFVFISQGVNISPPRIEGDMLFTILLGMLGLGGLRTFEKVKGVSK
jgi:hypothetical protein